MATWEKIKEVDLFLSERFHLIKKTFQLQDGENREYTTTKGRNNVIALCLTTDKKIIVIEQFRVGPEEVLIDLPSGGIDGNEKPEEAAQRELLEETGYRGEESVCIGSSYASPIGENTYMYVVITGCRKIGMPRLEEKQLGNIYEMEVEEFEKYLNSGRLTAGDLAGGYIGLAYIKSHNLI